MRPTLAGEIGWHTTYFSVVGLMLAVSACTESRLDLVWPSELEEAFIVVVPEDWRGALEGLEIQGPLRLDSIPRVELEVGPAARVFVLGPPPARTKPRPPRTREPSAWRLALRSEQLGGASSCRTEGWAHGDDELELSVAPVDGHALVFGLDDSLSEFVTVEATPFDDLLSFRIPIEPCFDGKRIVIRSFAEGPETRSELVTYRRGQLIDEDTVLAWSTDSIDVVSRGEPWQERRRVRNSDFGLPPAAPEQYWRVDAAALLGSSISAHGIAALSQGSISNEGTIEGRIFELNLNAERLSVGRELWRTYDPSRTSLHRIEAVAVDARGTWVATGERLVLTASTTNSAPVVYPQAGTFDGLYLKATGSSSRPFLLAGRGFLRWFDPARGEEGFDEIHLPLFEGANRILDAIATTPGLPAPSIVAVMSTLQIGRSSPGGGSWVSQPAPATSQEVGCVHGFVCGRPFLTQRNSSIVSGPPGLRPSVWLAPKSCTAAYLIDEENACAVSTALYRSPDIIDNNTDDADIYGADQLGDTTLLFGERGRILILGVE